jgi:5,6-dimethylbenzimidazole synthase
MPINTPIDMPIGTPSQPFAPIERDAVNLAIFERRDMRHFSGSTFAPEVMWLLLLAAHHAPSVDLMQPWHFIRVRSSPFRQSLHELVKQERVLTAGAASASFQVRYCCGQ